MYGVKCWKTRLPGCGTKIEARRQCRRNSPCIVLHQPLMQRLGNAYTQPWSKNEKKSFANRLLANVQNGLLRCPADKGRFDWCPYSCREIGRNIAHIDRLFPRFSGICPNTDISCPRKHTLVRSQLPFAQRELCYHQECKVFPRKRGCQRLRPLGEERKGDRRSWSPR
jgi:hypothetical protein